MSQTRRLAAILAADVAGFPAKIANSRAYGRSAPVDSLVERNGFELPVPRENGYRSESSGFVYLPETVRVSSKNPQTSGTEVSNPLPGSSLSNSSGAEPLSRQTAVSAIQEIVTGFVVSSCLCAHKRGTEDPI